MMKKYHYIILEIKEYDDKHHIKLWNKFLKKHRRFAKKAYRNLKRHCSSIAQYVFVKIYEKEK